MLTARLATAPDPDPFPGPLRVELEGLDPSKVIVLQMPKPGLASLEPNLPTPALPFILRIAYFLGDKSVKVLVRDVGDNDSINIFASRLDSSPIGGPGVLYVGKIIHSNQALTRNCGVRCEGKATYEDCCVICENGNIVTETCC